MWESSVPKMSETINPLLAASNHPNRQLINSYGNANADQSYDQGFQTCRSPINRFHNHSSDDDQVFSDDDEQGISTPKASKRKGPNNLVLKLTVQAIHLAVNAPMVSHSNHRNLSPIRFCLG